MTPSSSKKLSVIITSYNYAHFLSCAIDSVLSQSDDRVELIVVDDCSSDGSRDIIRGYGARLTAVLHEQNRGHGGAFNSGFAQASGDLVMFLDADDFLLPGAVETILGNHDPETVIYHYRMRLADHDGTLGEIYPIAEKTLASGDIAAKILTTGSYDSTLTSGLVFARSVLEKVLPMPAEDFRQGGDGYLSAVVPLYGRSASFPATISGYRRHQDNHSFFLGDVVRRARWVTDHDRARHAAIRAHAADLGLTVEENLHLQNLQVLELRLVFAFFDKDSASAGEYDRTQLCRAAHRCISDDGPLRVRIGKKVWWLAMQYLPEAAARTLLLWKIHAPSRPRVISGFARWLRRRTGIVLR